jgi:mono/diheme cytochrome c family protein
MQFRISGNAPRVRLSMQNVDQNAPRGGAGKLTRGTRFLHTHGTDTGARSALRRGCEESLTPLQGADSGVVQVSQGYVKDAYPWLISQHRFPVLLLVLLLASCTQQMADQPRYDPLQASDFFPDGSSARPLPVGVIPHDYPKQDWRETGMINGKPADRFPFPIDNAVMLRGQQRYNIYCSPCHDYIGTGNGMAAIRGFQRKPASFHSAELRAAPVGHFFDVITNGFGSMPTYANQIPVRDRWAITAYIRALQLSQSATINDVPAAERQKLESEKRK